MTIDNTQLNINAHIGDANSAKEIVLKRLLMDGIISNEQAEHYSTAWQIIIIKKSWFQRYYDKYMKGQDDGYFMKYVKFDDGIIDSEK